MIINEIMEALKFSQVRNFVKGWDKSRYKDIFSNPKYKHDKNSYRIFLPISVKRSDDFKIEANPEIEKFLNSQGYNIVDYIKGIVYDTNKKQNIKIGKVLQKLGRTDLLNKFNTDERRSGTNNEYIVVISRHPYDIAGMSTDRGWTSCMNLRTGQYRKYVPIDIKEGTIIAYVTKKSDLNLNNPTGRILIKPFIDSLGSDRVYLVPDTHCYGTNVDGFEDVVDKWVNEVNSSRALENIAIFQWNPKFYDDSSSYNKEFVTGMIPADEKEQIKLILDKPYMIKDMENPSETIQKIAVAKDGTLIKYLDNPSFDVTMAAVRENGDAIRFIKTPDGKINEETVDKKVLAAAVTSKPSSISYIENPSYDLQKITISNSLGAYRYIRNKDKKIIEFVEEKALNIYMADNTPIYVDKENKKVVTAAYDDLQDIAKELGFDTLKYIAKSYEGYGDYQDFSTSDYDTERVADLVERKYIEAFRKYLYSADLENGNMDEDEYDSKTFSEMIEDSDELSSAIQSAAYTGVETGSYNEMYDSIRKWLIDSPFEELSEEQKKKYNVKGQYALIFTFNRLSKSIIEYYDEDDNDTFDFDNYMNDSFKDDFDLSDIDEPRYGWSGFDDEAAIERFEEEIPSEVSDMVSKKSNKNESIDRLKKLAGLK